MFIQRSDLYSIPLFIYSEFLSDEITINHLEDQTIDYLSRCIRLTLTQKYIRWTSLLVAASNGQQAVVACVTYVILASDIRQLPLHHIKWPVQKKYNKRSDFSLLSFLSEELFIGDIYSIMLIDSLKIYPLSYSLCILICA